MPSSSQALTLPRTYISEAGLLPTRTAASPGRTPAAAMVLTPAATSPRMSLAIFVPSRMVAGIRPRPQDEGFDSKILHCRARRGRREKTPGIYLRLYADAVAHRLTVLFCRPYHRKGSRMSPSSISPAMQHI